MQKYIICSPLGVPPSSPSPSSAAIRSQQPCVSCQRRAARGRTVKDIFNGGAAISHSGVTRYSPSITNVLTTKPTGTHSAPLTLPRIAWQLSPEARRRPGARTEAGSSSHGEEL